MNIEIGSTVEFIHRKVKFRGTVMAIAHECASVAVLGQHETFSVRTDNCLPIPAEHPAILLGIPALRQMALELGWQIEKCGASEELTKAAVMASALTTKLNELLP